MVADATPFPLPSLKFRTAGFPQYGFKPSWPAITFAAGSRLLIDGQWSGSVPLYPWINQGNRAGWLHGPLDPEALGSPTGYVVPPGHCLLRPHPRLWPSVEPAYCSSSDNHLDGQRFPALSCLSFLPCHRPYPGGSSGG